MSTLGIDISTWQTVTPDLSGLSFVICRATYATGKDARYDMHSANVLSHGKVLGAYHFGRRAVDYSIASQVAAFLSVAGNAHFLALDLETDGGTLMSNTDATAFIKALKAADAKKRRVVLYHSLSGFPTGLGQDGNWVAKWSSTPPSIPWLIWQNADTYKGLSSNGDADIYAGTDAELRTWVGTTGGTTDMLAVVTQDKLAGPNPRRFIVPANAAKIPVWDPAKPGAPVKYLGPFAAPSPAHADATAAIAWPGETDPPSPHGSGLLHVVDGAAAGLYIAADKVTLDPAGTNDYASGYKDAKTKAASAVGGI